MHHNHHYSLSGWTTPSMPCGCGQRSPILALIMWLILFILLHCPQIHSFVLPAVSFKRSCHYKNAVSLCAEAISSSISISNAANSTAPFQPEDSLNGQQSDATSEVSRPTTPIKSWLRRIIPSTDNDSEERKKDNWLNWMMRGRGTDKIIMREAEELGGLPRGDRYSSKDWFHIAITMPNSGILRSIRSPVVAMTSWATFLSLLHDKLLKVNPVRADHMYLPTTPHSLMMSALGLLLVFRTNSAYQRFAEGRKIWEGIVNTARDLSRMLMLYDSQIGVAKRRRIQRLLVAFPYLLRHRIRPNLVVMRRLDDEEHPRDPENSILLYQDAGIKDNDPEAAWLAKSEELTGISRRKKRTLFWVDKRTLPWRLLPGEDALEKCARAQNRPLWVCDRIAAEIRKVPDSPHFTARERLALLKYVDHLSRCIGGAERIHQTVIPLNYARHTLRALTLWLFSLPFALVKDLRMLTGPVLFFVSWLLFGVYEIGYAIEDPFQGTLRLSILCDTIRRDVLGDEYIRGSAFKLDGDEEEDEEDRERVGILSSPQAGNSTTTESLTTSSPDAYQ